MDKPKIKLPAGTGVYETLAIVGRRPAFLERHLARLEKGAEWLGIPRARERVQQMILSKLASCPEAPTAMRADAPGHGIPGTSSWPRDRDTAPGARVGLYFPKQGKARGPEDTIKHTQRAAKTTARNEAKGAGCWDAIVVDPSGTAVETTVANLFAFLEGTLVTPGDDHFPLPGIARSVVLEEAARLGVPTAFRGLTFEDLTRAEEVFVTNSIVGVLPVGFVVHVDGRRIDLPGGHVRTAPLVAAFRAREEADLTTAPGPPEDAGG